MKQLAVRILLFLLIIPSSAHAQPPSPKVAINALVKAFEDAYLTKGLGKLDVEHHYSRKVRIVIDNSLASPRDPNKLESKDFKTFAELEQWLRDRAGSQYRAVVGPHRCKKGFCTYDPGPLDHSHMYLKKIAYGYKRGRPYIKTVFLVDGN